jgi:orotate phosphoribosyltransferase
LELEEPVRLASGDWSRWFVDAKKALSAGADLRLACQAMVALADEMNIGEIDAAGGLTLGADQFSHGVALITGCEWFVVRKAPKGRGTNRRVEGADLGPGWRVLLVDDVITRGGSIQEAYGVVRETGARIVGAIALVDRGGHADGFFASERIPYRPLMTHHDLGIPAVGEE